MITEIGPGRSCLVLLCCFARVARNLAASIEVGNRQWQAAVARVMGQPLLLSTRRRVRSFSAGSQAVMGMAAIQKFWQGVIRLGIRGGKSTNARGRGP